MRFISWASLLLALLPFSMAQACEPDLSGLAQVLPDYPNVMELAILRENILLTTSERLVEGLGADMAANAYTGYLLGLEASQPQAEACVRKQAAAPEHALASLAQGSFLFGSGEVEDSCATSYVRYLYSRSEAEAASRITDCRASKE